MSDEKGEATPPAPAGFSRFAAFGSSLRAQAQELQAKAAEGVTKISEQAKTVSLANAAAATTPKQPSDGDATESATTPDALASPTATATAPSSLASLKADSVSKDELLDILQKLNKKVKALTIMRAQLTERCETVERDKARLKELVVEEILNGAVDMNGSTAASSDVDEVQQLQMAWRKLDEEKALTLQQLQQEYQKVALAQQQQSATAGSNGLSADASTPVPLESAASAGGDWLAEKQALQERHEQEVKELREQLVELQQQQQSASGNEEDATAKIKAAAQLQLLAFKKKVAAARQEELAKLRTELAEQAASELETKLAEQAKGYEARLAAGATTGSNGTAGDDADSATATITMLQQQLAELKEQQSTQIQSLEKEHAEKVADAVEKTRQQVEQAATTDIEERLQECIGDLRRNHAIEMETVQQQAAAQLAEARQNAASLTQQAESAKEQIDSLQAELAAANMQNDRALVAVQSQVDSESSEKISKVQAIQSELDSRELELATTLEKEKSLVMELEQANAALAAAREENESIKAASQSNDEASQSVNEAMAKQRTLFDEELLKLKAEHDEQLETLRIELQAAEAGNKQIGDLESELEVVKQQHDAALCELQTKLDSLSSEKEIELQTMQAELDSRKQQRLVSLVDKEQSLSTELEQARSVLLATETEREAALAASQASNDQANRSFNEAMSKQRSAFEDEIARLKSAHDDQIASLRKDVGEMDASAVATDAELSSLRMQLAKRAAELDNIKATSGDEIDDLRRQVQELQSSLATRESEQEVASQLLSKAEASKEDSMKEANSLKHQLAQTIANGKKEIAALKQLHETAVADFTRQIEDKNRELGAVSSSESNHSVAFSELQKVFQELQAKYKTLKSESSESLEKLRSEHSDLLNEKAEIENSWAQTRHSLDAATIASAKEVEELQTHLTLVSNQNEEKLKSLQADYDKMCDKVTSLEASSSQHQADYEIHANTLREELIAQVEALKSENAALLDARTAEGASLESLTNKTQQLTQTLEQRDSIIEELRKQERALLENLQKKEEAIKCAHDEHEGTVSRLKKDVETARQQLADAIDMASTTDEDVATKLNELAAKKDEEIRLLKAHYEDEIKSLRKELDAARASVEHELASRMAKQKTEFEEQISSIERKQSDEKEEIRKSMESHVDAMQTRFKEKLDVIREEAQTELARVTQENVDKEQQLSMLTERNNALTAASTILTEEKEDLSARLEAERSKFSALQEQLASLRTELNEASRTHSASVTENIQQQQKLDREKIALLDQLGKLKIAINAKSNKVEELTGKVEALTANLNDMAEQRRIQEEKLRTATENEARLKVSDSEVDSLREQINKLKLEMTQNATLVSRLQSERDANERNQGERSALVGMLESKLAELNDRNSELNAKLEAALYDLNQREEAINDRDDKVRKLENELLDAEARSKRASDALAMAQKGADANSSKRVDSLQKELQTVKQQMARKSAAAQKMLQEREAECAELRKSTKALQHEVEKGSLSDRKIFELAEKQSNRESMLASEIEARNKTIDKLQAALISRDDELATVEAAKEKAEGEVDELCRVKRREDVNVDYLKSIIVQYLSLPSGSTERAGLLPVIATLLQFNPQDYRRIETGKNKISWWGNIAPTLISAPATSSEGTSEVMVSAPSPPADGQHKTALQF